MNKQESKHYRRIRRAKEHLAEAMDYLNRARTNGNITAMGEAELAIFHWNKVLNK